MPIHTYGSFSCSLNLHALPKLRLLMFWHNLIHHYPGGAPASILFYDDSKNIVLAIHADTFAVMSLDSGVVGKNRDIAEKMHLDICWVEHFQRGAIGPSQDSKPLRFCVGYSIA